MMTVRYFRVTEMARLQKISDSTPSTASALKVPAAPSADCIAYSGLVPMSPYTMPMAPITADALTRRELFMWIAGCGPAQRRRLRRSSDPGCGARGGGHSMLPRQRSKPQRHAKIASMSGGSSASRWIW